MNKKILIIILFVLALTASSLAQEAKKVCFNNACVGVEIADSDHKRQRGLMFRKEMPQDKGMLFVFENEDKHGFWMMNMQFPIDIIWISGDKRIVDMQVNVAPCAEDASCGSLVPVDKARYVLEVNAGFAAKHHIKPGDKADMSFLSSS